MREKNSLSDRLEDLKTAHVKLLYSTLAEKLAECAVKLEWRKPLLDGSRGLTMRNGKGVIIQIDPGLDYKQKFRTFLHECGHARLHRDGMAQKSDFDQVYEVRAVKGKQVMPDWLMDNRREASRLREKEANQLADNWEKIAGSGNVRERLRRLLD